MGVEVDATYVQEIGHRPKPTKIEVEGIPVIDLSILHSPDHSDADLARLVSEIGDACQKWGFFQVINHGIPLECREKLESTARKFFALPKEEKVKVRRDEVYTMGYYDEEHSANTKDWKELFDAPVTDHSNLIAELDEQELGEVNLIRQWPENLPELREACEDFALEAEKLSFKLLGLVALSLGLPKNRLDGYCEGHTGILRLLYYPPCPSPDLAMGCGAHKDAGVLSVLAQDETGGLEVWSKFVGDWIHVKPIPNAYVINLGDVTEVWSNNKYESALHRVRANCEKERFSIPFFLIPSRQTWVEPLEELINEQNPRKYKPYNYGKFLAGRKHSNFQKLQGESVQITQFKIDD